MRVQVVDPSAFTPPYDHGLCAALARAGQDVELVTSKFAYGQVAAPDGYRVRELFYRHIAGAPGTRVRQLSKLLLHGPDMVRLARAARHADVVHFQWLDVPWLDRFVLPRRPIVLTAHDLLPREPRPGQVHAQRRSYDAIDAVVVHSQYGRAQLIDVLGLEAQKVRVIHHGAFDHLRTIPARGLPDELRAVEGPVTLFFGLLRPYKGIETLISAWRGVAVPGAELWIVGRRRMPIEGLRATAPPGVRFVSRFVADDELAAFFRRADLVVLPYSRTERFDQSGVLATALAFGKPTILSDVGGFPEVAAAGAARLIGPDDPRALADALNSLLGDPEERGRLAAAARAAADGPYSWDEAARLTVELYRELV